tara:strand:- start:3375 stop:3737 length:363 start_codon:yes stop_codon:yes gene_type:complete
MAYTMKSKKVYLQKRKTKKGGATKKISGTSLEKKLKTAETRLVTAEKNLATAELNLTKANDKLRKQQLSLEASQSKFNLATENLGLAMQNIEKINAQIIQHRQQRQFSPKVQRVSKPRTL